MILIDTRPGQVSEFYYADYLDTNIINQNKMIYLQTFGEAWGLMPDKYAVAFLDKLDAYRTTQLNTFWTVNPTMLSFM